jgi:regulator of cell morphogenesis and NO signaling
MAIASSDLVSDVATRYPGTVRVFRAHGLDFCCGGRRPIAVACADAGLSVDQLLAELETASALPEDDDIDWLIAPIPQLVQFIVDTFHAPLRDDLPRLRETMGRVETAHGHEWPAVIGPLAHDLERLSADLLDHIGREEREDFPAMVDAATEQPDRTFDVARLERLEADHAAIGARLKDMARVTGWFQPPVGACPTVRVLFAELACLAEATYMHVHLENNVLFPRITALARSAREPRRDG